MRFFGIHHYNKKNEKSFVVPQETMALAFFDLKVSLEEKRRKVKRLKYREPIVKLMNDRSLTNPEVSVEHNLSDFVSHKTKNFFTAFCLSAEFLELDPSESELWEWDIQEARVFLS